MTNIGRREHLCPCLGLQQVLLGGLAPIYLGVEIWCKHHSGLAVGCVDLTQASHPDLTRCAWALASCCNMRGDTESAGQVREIVLTHIRAICVLGRSWVEKINLDDGPWRLLRPLFMCRHACQTACHVAVAYLPQRLHLPAICVEGAEMATAGRPRCNREKTTQQ